MNARLAWLYARRSASPAALTTLALAVVAAHLATAPNASRVAALDAGAAATLAFDRARTLWVVALLVLGAGTLLRAASIGQRWVTGEGDWLGVAAVQRRTIVASALAGTLLGTMGLTLIAAFVIGLATGRGEACVEPLALAGPERSIVLRPGESFIQDLDDVSAPDGSTVRVRVMPTVGGVGPTTTVTARTPGGELAAAVARRTWIELPLARASEGQSAGEAAPGAQGVVLTNDGDGALAVIGPTAVEVWRPSRAWLGGHLRVGQHAALFMAFAVALAFAAGAWMRPGVAGALTFSLWLASGASGARPEWLPGGAGMTRALGAIAEGRCPLPPSLLGLGAAAIALVAASFAAAPALRSWHHEARL